MGFAMMGLEAISPGLAKIAGGLSGMANGLAAVKTGLALFSLGPVGAIAGLICIGVGAATMAVGFNDAVNGATGTNYIREWTGMSEEAYANLSMALNIASTVCTVAGNAARYFRGSRCFIAGTLVACMGLDGKECKKKIEDIQEGDMVWAYDEETGTSDWKPVVKLFRNKSKDWTGITIGGNEIVSTPGHKYYLPENTVNRNPNAKLEHANYAELSEKWVSAEDLKVGDRVLLSNGEYGIVQKVRSIHCDTPQTTYYFEVEGYHTYFVGENSICVHNKWCAYDYLDYALEQNGATRADIPELVENAPRGQWEYTWTSKKHTYSVRMHAGEAPYTNAKYVFRVSRQTYGQGWEFLGLNKKWYLEKAFKPFYKNGLANPLYDELGAIMTHLPIIW